jgi:hypothetical protein
MAGVAAMIAVSSMVCQFALLRLSVPGAPSTTVMTGNLTNTVLALLDTLSRTQPLTEANERLEKDLEGPCRLLRGLRCGGRSGLITGQLGMVNSRCAGRGGSSPLLMASPGPQLMAAVGEEHSD